MKWVWITIKEVGFSSNQLLLKALILQQLSRHRPTNGIAHAGEKRTHEVFFFPQALMPWWISFLINFKKTQKNPQFLWLASPGLRTFHYFSSLVSYVNNIKTNLLLGKIAWCKWKQSLWSMNLLPHNKSSPSLLSLLKWELWRDAAAVCTFISGVNMKD